jgi:tetratricopeptide (TPR) repeat protein
MNFNAVLQTPAGPIYKYFWLVFIVVTVINAFRFRKQVQPLVRNDPSLAPGYRKLFIGSIFWANVPWILIGIGILSGRVRIVYEYLMPSQGNPTVLAWWAVMLVLMVLCTFWILLGGGAELLEKHPGYFISGIASRKIKWIWVGICIFNVFIALWLFRVFSISEALPLGFQRIIPYLFPAVFIGGWFFVSYRLSITSGWQTLAQYYEHEDAYRGKTRSTFGQFGSVRYSDTLTAGLDGQGIYLSVFWPFSFGHKPLFIPWTDLTASLKKIYFTRYVEFKTTTHPAVTFSLPEKLFIQSFGTHDLPANIRFLQSRCGEHVSKRLFEGSPLLRVLLFTVAVLSPFAGIATWFFQTYHPQDKIHMWMSNATDHRAEVVGHTEHDSNRSPQDTSDWYQRGQQSYEKKTKAGYEEAIHCFTSAIKNGDDTYDIHFWLGCAYRHVGQNEDSIQQLDRALDIKPDAFYGILNRGLALEGSGQIKRALVDFNRCIYLKPNHPWAYLDRGNIYQRMKQYDLAIADYGRAILIDKTYATAYNNRGNVLMALRRYSEAMSSFDEAIRLNPEYGAAYGNRAILHRLLGQQDQESQDLAHSKKLASPVGIYD